jgi:hypothetical protein
MSELKPFESLRDFEMWKNDEYEEDDRLSDPERPCPICRGAAIRCPHSFHEQEQQLRADLLVREVVDAANTSVANYGEIRITDREIRITDAATGGQKGQKLERFDLIPVEPLRALARLYGRGAQKYEDDNWRRGYRWRLSIGAALRHFFTWCAGKSYDTANGLKDGPIEHDAEGKPIHMGEHHLTCVVWHCFTLISFELHGLGTDDRAKTVEV